MPHDVVAELPAQSNSAVRYTEGMNKWFQESLQNNRPWMETLITAGIKLHFEKSFAPMFQELCGPVLEDIGKALAKDRRVRREEDEAVVAEMKRWVEGKLESKLVPRIEALEQRVAQHIGQSTSRTDVLAETITAERAARENEIRTAVQGVKDWTTERPETRLPERLEALEQRFAQYVGQASGRSDALSEAIAAERGARENDAKTIAADVKNSVGSEFKTELAALAERMKAMPGRLPVARVWQPENVVYEGQFVSHGGALWQARQDTATTPGGDAWVCVARAGQDAITPTVRDTYDAREKYQQLDIVAMDGGSFIAKRDDPGVCPGDGWRLLAKQGRVGRPGRSIRGERGERGETGPAVMPKLISSKIDENYNLVILRADDSLEIIPLREGYERYHHETSE